MRRREFIAALGGAAAMPLAARAQQRPIPLIGYLDGSGLPRWFEAFRHGLNALGYVQGQTIVVEQRSAVGQSERLPELAAELVRLQPKIIVASGSPAAVAARNAAPAIPIVFTFATDPIGLGLIASLARPGSNVTGQSNQGPGLVGKRLQLLADMLPGASRFSVVWSPTSNVSQIDFREMQAAAGTLRVGSILSRSCNPGILTEPSRKRRRARRHRCSERPAYFHAPPSHRCRRNTTQGSGGLLRH